MSRKALLICSMLVALALIPTIKMVQAAPSVTDGPRWVAPAYKGTDDFFGGISVLAYTMGTNAKLVVKVHNDFPKAPFNVYVAMDWATTNQTSGDVEIPSNQDYAFEMSIPIPTTANPLVLHSYKILVKYEDRTTTPATIKWLGPYTEATPSPDINFAVYSADQADFQQLKKEYTQWRSSYTSGGLMSLLGMTAKAKELWVSAAVASFLGDESYEAGSFSDAKTHYGTALNSTKNAITLDIDKTASLEDTLIGLVDAAKGFLSMQGYAFIVFSMGFMLMGVGALIYLIRRSKPPTP